MRMGSVDTKLRETLAMNTSELTQQFAAAMRAAQDEVRMDVNVSVCRERGSKQGERE